MFEFLRTIKRTIYKIKGYLLFPFIARSFFVFFLKNKSKRFKVSPLDIMPCLFENIPYTRFDTHYVYHTAWAARKVKEINAQLHIDISSSLYFSSIVSAFVPVKFYDYRPAKLNLSNLVSEHADLLKLQFPSNSIDSLSCMHTVEHVGLGRYGDPLDPNGDLKAVAELSRVTKKGGNLLFVVPIGKPKIEFNAHRIYSYNMVKEMFPDFSIKEFSLIPDDALSKGMQYNATEEMANKQNYGCGCFWFIKN
ncbi:MAG: hypothetical protein QG653_181 [Patescibacteria group bacterium]|nr:hypothetical protein [Patescibacteria group bacterium]